MNRKMLPILALLVALGAGAWLVWRGDSGALDDPTPVGPAEGGEDSDLAIIPRNAADPAEPDAAGEAPAPEASASPTLVVTVTDPDDRPVPGASIRLLARSALEQRPWWRGPSKDQIEAGIRILEEGDSLPGQRITAGDDGVARATDVEPGEWFVEASASGFAAVAAPNVQVPASGEARATLRLMPAAAISGRVKQKGDRPAAAARIVAVELNDAGNFPYTVVEIATAAQDGTFIVPGLLPGEVYALFAMAGDGQVGISPRVEAPREGVEISCGPRFTVVGSVRDSETGAPIEGVELTTVLGVATTDERGDYRLEGMIRNILFRLVWAEKDGYEPASEEVGGMASLFSSEVRLDFQLVKIKPGALRVTVQDSGGRPLPGVALTVRAGDRQDANAGVTDERGEALFPSLAPGSASIEVAGTGTVLALTHRVDGREITLPMDAFWAQIQSGEEATAALTLHATTSISGAVRDAAGSPIAGVRVEIGSRAAPPTGPDGRFRVDFAPAGRVCRVEFRAEEFRPESVVWTAGDPGEIQVVMRRGAEIAGQVVDEEGKPVPGANVSLLSTGAAQAESIQSAPDGRFRFAGLAEGRYWINVWRRDFAPLKVPEFDLAAEERREDLRPVLSRGVAVRIRLVSPSGKPTRGQVFAVGPLDAPAESWQRLQTFVAGDAGEGSEVRAAPGRYSIVATPPVDDEESGALASEISLATDGELRLVLPAERHVVRLAPESSQGKRLLGAVLRRTEPSQPEFSIWREVGPDGVTISGAVPPGTYAAVPYVSNPQGGWETLPPVVVESVPAR